MRKPFILLLSLALVFTVPSCSILSPKETAEITNETETIDEEETEISEDTSLTEMIPEETTSAATIASKQAEDADISEASASYANRFFLIDTYRSIMEKIVSEHVLPGGVDLQWGEIDMTQISDSQFAVYDIDMDGEDELIVQSLSGSSASMREYIYGYDIFTGGIKEEFSGPLIDQYFDNGCMISTALHNYSQSTALWPYTVYSYDKESDAYLYVADVFSWDRTLGEDDAFPEDIDQDGDGILYILSSMDDQGGEVRTILDFAEYDSWLETYLAKANEIVVPYISITPENIIGIK